MFLRWNSALWWPGVGIWCAGVLRENVDLVGGKGTGLLRESVDLLRTNADVQRKMVDAVQLKKEPPRMQRSPAALVAVAALGRAHGAGMSAWP